MTFECLCYFSFFKDWCWKVRCWCTRYDHCLLSGSCNVCVFMLLMVIVYFLVLFVDLWSISCSWFRNYFYYGYLLLSLFDVFCSGGLIV